MTDYSALKPVPGEDRYVDFDEEFQLWGLFGADSGFCYRMSDDKEELES